MKKLIWVLVFLLAVFVVYNRQRLYVHDPMGSVTRDGVKEDGTSVYINFNNDVLLPNRPAPFYMTVIQHGNHVGEPKVLPCIHFVVCLLDADVVTLMQPTPADVTVQSMDSKTVVFTEGKHQTVVALR